MSEKLVKTSWTGRRSPNAIPNEMQYAVQPTGPWRSPAWAPSMRIIGLLGALVMAVPAVAGCAPSLPPGERTCVGFPAEVCGRQVAELEREAMTHGGLVAYRIVCTSGSCTAAQGEGKETVVFADGSGREGGFGYASPVGPPPVAPSRGPLPVTPTCLGVPDGWCTEMARTGVENVADWSSIMAVVVRCTTSCSPTVGDGETRIRLADGSEQTVGWGYNGEVPPGAP